MRISLSQFARDIHLAKATVFRKCQELNISTSDGLTPEDCTRLRQVFDIQDTPPPLPSAKVEVETGNHRIVLSPPTLPQNYTLESLRNSEAISFEDPLAIASQFLNAANQLQEAMEEDLKQREAKLNQTRQAQKQISDKVDELKLETRFYTERARNLDTALNHETDSLQEALGVLQKLGKQPNSNG